MKTKLLIFSCLLTLLLAATDAAPKSQWRRAKRQVDPCGETIDSCESCENPSMQCAVCVGNRIPGNDSYYCIDCPLNSDLTHCQDAGQGVMGIATKCLDGFRLNAEENTCTPCIVGCKQCQLNPEDCDPNECLDGYAFNIATNSCTVCPPRCGNCSYPSPDLNSTTTTMELTCFGCAAGSYMKGGLCLDCGVGCEICEAEVGCVKCAVGYYAASVVDVTVTCSPCSVLKTGCSACTETDCTECFPEDSQGQSQILVEGVCQACPPNCKTCSYVSGQVTCSECNPYYGLDANGVCGSCGECYSCEFDADLTPVCTSCPPGTAVIGAAICDRCPENCLVCTKSEQGIFCQPDKCDVGYTRNSLGDLCLPCPENCVGGCSYSETTQGTICNDDACAAGYTVGASGQCIECPPNCVGGCVYNEAIQGAACNVDACSAGYTLDAVSGQCIQCPTSCSGCTVEDGNVYCSVGMCMVGTLRNEATKLCDACPANCDYCYLSSKGVLECMQCSTGFVLDPVTNKCLACDANCDACEADASGTVICQPHQCSDGFYRDESDGTCKECGVTECVYCEASGTCLECSPGFIINTDGDECLSTGACADGAVVVDNVLKCSSCASGWYATDAGSPTICAECSDKLCQTCDANACLTCQSGMPPVQGSTCLHILGCKTTSIDSTTFSCTECVEGFVLENNKCYQCPSNCQTCDFDNNFQCTACNDGYTLTTDGTCAKCPSDQIYGDYCLSCDDPLTKCTECKFGYVSTGSLDPACAKCGDNGDFCEYVDLVGKTFYGMCSPGYIMDDDSDRSCLACPEGYGRCLIVNGQVVGVLDTCKIGFAYNAEDQTCLPCKPGCTYCSTTGNCESNSCEPEYYLDSSGDCIACSTENCLVCPGDVCQTCADGYYLDGTSCSACTDTNCLVCPGDTCQTCADGYYLDGTSCSACSTDNCASCPGGSCDSCKTGYNLVGTECISCASSTNCKFCETADTCSAGNCNDGYYFDDSPVCTSCSTDNCASCPGGSCDSCKTGYNLVGTECISCASSTNCKFCETADTCSAGNCNDGYYFEETDGCTSCTDTNCLVCPGDTCQTCADGYYFDGTSCSACTDANCLVCPGDTCQTCADGYYLDDTSCSACLTDNCLVCPGDVCQTCADGYYLDDTSCSACSTDNCASCPGGSCDSCKTGYNLVGTECISCASSTNCKFCETADMCSAGNCNDGYYFDDTDGCTPCTDTNCLVCPGDTCQTCADGYYLDGTSCSACTDTNALACPADTTETCAEGYYVKSALCSACTDTNCLVCPGDTCQTCADGYYLDGTSCSACTDTNCLVCPGDTCQTCADGYYFDGTSCSEMRCDGGQKHPTGACSSISPPAGCLYYVFESITDPIPYCPEGFCRLGYTWKSSDKTSPSGYRLGSCEACPANCLNCFMNGASTECLSSGCNSGFVYMADGTCQACPTGCLACSVDNNGNVACDSNKCMSGYAQTTDNLCIACPSGCMTCTFDANTASTVCSDKGCMSDYSYISSTMCIACPDKAATCQLDSNDPNQIVSASCDAGYVITSYGTCFACPQKCQACSLDEALGVTACTSCIDGYALSPLGTCAICPDFCGSCTVDSGGSFTCTSCVSGYTVNPVGSCEACPDNCNVCTFDDSNQVTVCAAGECAAGYSQDPTTMECTKCDDDNCLTCFTNGSCVPGGCKLGFHSRFVADKWDCEACTDNCDHCENNIQCLPQGCKDAFVRNSAGLCKECGTGCTKCDIGPNDVITCTACTTEYVLNNGICEACPANCQSCVYDTTSNAVSCSICVAGYYLEDISPKTCAACSTNCVSCSSSTTCTNCEDQDVSFYLTGGACYSCPANCITCISSESSPGCSQCADGYRISTDADGHYICEKCADPNCLNCKDDAATCTQCLATHYLDTGSCVACSQDLTCIECGTDGICTTCPPGYYLSDTNQCLRCPGNCMQCDANGCLTCNSGYILNDGQCGRCPLHCTQCSLDPTTQIMKCESSQCENGYGLDASKYNCIDCPTLTGVEYCATCNDIDPATNKSVCLSCMAPRYVLADNGASCLDCASIDNCASCVDREYVCSSCSSSLVTSRDRTVCGAMCYYCLGDDCPQKPSIDAVDVYHLDLIFCPEYCIVRTLWDGSGETAKILHREYGCTGDLGEEVTGADGCREENRNCARDSQGYEVCCYKGYNNFNSASSVQISFGLLVTLAVAVQAMTTKN